MQAFWMIVSSFLFASMGMCIKFASAHFNSAEILFYRGVIGIAFMTVYARLHQTSLRTPYPVMHARRSLVGVLAMAGWFYALAYLPLATAMTLNQMSNIWLAAFLVGSAIFLRKPKSSSRAPLVLTILVSFAGVIMVLRPAIDQNQTFPAVIGLLSGIGSAMAAMQIVAIARLGEPDIRTVFYFAVGTTVAGALGILVAGSSPWNWQQAGWLLGVGVLSSLAQLCMTRAYAIAARRGGMLMLANLQYCGIVFAALYSVILLGDNIPMIGWAGIATITLSAIAATVLRARGAKPEPPPIVKNLEADSPSRSKP